MAGENWAVKLLFQGQDAISDAIKSGARSLDLFENAAKKSFKESGIAADGFTDKVKSIGAGVALGNLITRGVDMGINALKKLGDAIPEYTNRLDDIGKGAQKIGLSAESFQKLNYAAELSNVSTEKLSGSFNFLNKNLGSGSLVKFLDENNRALAAQVKGAKSNEEVFYSLSDAISGEADIARRAALGNAAFGKSWSELVPLFADGSSAMREIAESVPNLASDGAIARAQIWNDTWTTITRTIGGFMDTVKEAVIKYLLPYLQVFGEWIGKNRELIQQKIHEVIKKIVDFVKELIPKIQRLVQFFQKWGPAILAVGAAIMGFFIAVNAVIAVKKAVDDASAAFTILNAVIAANPIGLIITLVVAAIAAAIIGMKALSEQVGGLGNAFKVVGKTIMKVLLTPINLVLEGISGIIALIADVTDAKWAKSALAGVKSFQNAMNTMLTGSNSTVWNSGGAAITDPYNKARAEYLAGHPAAGKSDESKWEAMFAEFQKQSGLMETVADNTGETVESVNNLKGGGRAKGLNYSQMGQDDFWSIVRAGA